MALSNIFNEPRREITESLIGAVVTVLPFAISARWLYVRWANSDTWLTGEVTDKGVRLINSPFDLEGCAGTCASVRTYLNLEVLAAALAGALAISAIIWIAIYFTHWAGEEFCDWLANGGHDPRPKQRKAQR